MPSSFLSARASLWGAPTYLQASLNTQSATVTCHFSLVLQYVSGNKFLHTSALGAFDQDEHRWLQGFAATKNRPYWSSLPKTCSWWERYNTWSVQQLSWTGDWIREQTAGQKPTGLGRWEGVSWGLQFNPSVVADFPQTAKKLLGFNPLCQCIFAVLRVLLFLLACNASAVLPGLLDGLHQHVYFGIWERKTVQITQRKNVSWFAWAPWNSFILSLWQRFPA